MSVNLNNLQNNLQKMENPLQGYTIGNVLGTLLTGTVRIPGYMASLIAAVMVGELALRAIETTLSTMGWKPQESQLQKWAEKTLPGGFRPFAYVQGVKNDGSEDKNTLKDLIKRIAFFVISGICISEFANVIGGSANTAYNNVLPFLGVVRIDTRHYWSGVNEVLTKYGVAF